MLDGGKSTWEYDGRDGRTGQKSDLSKHQRIHQGRVYNRLLACSKINHLRSILTHRGNSLGGLRCWQDRSILGHYHCDHRLDRLPDSVGFDPHSSWRCAHACLGGKHTRCLGSDNGRMMAYDRNIGPCGYDN